MPQREFDITIGADGEVELHVKGYKGKTGCQGAIKIFEQIQNKGANLWVR